jgi:hypothetical protein
MRPLEVVVLHPRIELRLRVVDRCEHLAVQKLVAHGPKTQLNRLRADRTAPVNPVVTIDVDDVTELHRQMAAAGWKVVHPLTREEWGVLRFFVEDPSGNVVNVTSHARPDASDLSQKWLAGGICCGGLILGVWQNVVVRGSC